MLGSNIPITHRTLSPDAHKQSGIRGGIRDATRSFQNFSGLFAGRVIRVDAANNCCDIALQYGGILHEVAILQANAGTIDGVYSVPKIRSPKKKDQQNTGTNTTTPSGTAGTPTSVSGGNSLNTTGNSSPPDQAAQKAKEDDDDDVDSDDGRVSWSDIKDADLANSDNKRDTWAICGYVLASVNMPVVLGFFFPHSTQMSIKQDQPNKKDRIDYLRRLPSRAYELHLRGGTYELNFPDGSHFRVGLPKEPKEGEPGSGEGDQTEGENGQGDNPVSPLAVGDPLDLGPTPGPIPADTGLPQNKEEEKPKEPGEFYDDADDDPDGRIVLGKDQYENLDVKDKPWKIKRDVKKRRMMLVHSTKAKLGLCERGVVHIQNFTDAGTESSPPTGYDELDDPTTPQQKIGTGDLDAHQRRIWRARWGDQAVPPDKPLVGEHWFDPQERRNRYYIKAPSDGGGAGSLNDPSWQNAPAIGADPDGTGVPGEEGTGDPNANPPNRGHEVAESNTGTYAKSRETSKLNDHGIYADSMVGGRMGTSKWSGNNGIDVFVPDGSPFRAPADGTITFESAPSPSPLDPGGQMHGATIQFTSGELSGIWMHLLHITPGTNGPFSAGDILTTAHDPGLGNPNGPGGCNWQHFDVAVAHSNSFAGMTPSGDINAAQFLMEKGFNISLAQGQTSGPEQLMQGGCPFDNAGGEGSSEEGGKQDAKRQWYMPAATPYGGGVKGKTQPIGEKCLDSKAAEKGGRGMIDAAAVDHVHAYSTGEDDDIQPMGSEGSMGSAGSGSRLALANHIHPGPPGGMWMPSSMTEDLAAKIEALEQRVRELESQNGNN